MKIQQHNKLIKILKYNCHHCIYNKDFFKFFDSIYIGDENIRCNNCVFTKTFKNFKSKYKYMKIKFI